MNITAFNLAQRYVGVREITGAMDHPLISWWLGLCSYFAMDSHDEIPWCSAFVNGIAWELRLPRSKSASARSWLKVGVPVQRMKPPFVGTWPDVEVGFDVVILQRGGGNQPGPEVLKAPGHVGFYAGREDGYVLVLGGNQSDEVNISRYPMDRILGIRRLHDSAV